MSTSLAPVSVCLIVRNEAGQLESCLKSIRPYVAEICIVDTGSNDSTPDIAQKYADKFEVYTGCNNAQGAISSFSDARDKSFSLATQPWVMWVDGDDEVQNARNLPSLISFHDSIRNGGPSLVMLPYEYSHDTDGRVTCLHYRERLVTPREQFYWMGRVHEVLQCRVPVTHFQSDDVRIIHRRDSNKKAFDPMRNLRILKEHYDQNGEADVRQLYYLGLEYANNGDFGQSIKFHKRYVELSGWDDERFLAALEIAKHYQGFGDYDNAIDWALKALTIREGWAEAYFSLARSFYFLALRGGPGSTRCWEKCAHFAQHGLSLPPTKTILFVNPLERDFDVHLYLNFALSKIGQIDKALESVERGLSVKPDNQMLLTNKRAFSVYLAKNKINAAMNSLIEYKELNPIAVENIKLILSTAVGPTAPPSTDSNIPNSPSLQPEKLSKVPNQVVCDKPDLGDTQTSSIESISAGKLDIVIYVGSSVEAWNPVTAAKKGIGGSETAVIEMSRNLASLGHRVRVYGDCSRENLEGTFDKVDYIDHEKCKNINCDIFISSRRADPFDDDWSIKRKAGFCWVHDVHLGMALNHARAVRIDKFLTLSNWHRDLLISQYRFIHPSQVIKTRNGIDLTRFNKNVKRNPHRAVYSSSPDRGMQVAITIWPRVRERVPGAELHIFYGFQTWEVSADEGQRKLIAYLKQMIEHYANAGVTYHGRVDQQRLAEEYLKSGVWAYSTWFSETSCISAMEAHAAGLRMVTSPIAALNETVGERGKMISGDWLSIGYQNAFIDAVVEAMQKTDDSDRLLLQQYARDNFGWPQLAHEWEKMFHDVIKEVQLNIMPPYKGIL